MDKTHQIRIPKDFLIENDRLFIEDQAMRTFLWDIYQERPELFDFIERETTEDDEYYTVTLSIK